MDKQLLDILTKMSPNVEQMAEYIGKNITTAMSTIDQPCGLYLISKNIYSTLLQTAGITEEEFKSYLTAQFKQQSSLLNAPALGYVITNPLYNLLVLYILAFLAHNRIDDAYATARLYACFTISYLKKKYFQSCNPEVLKYTLSNLHGLSVAGKYGFSGLVLKIADETLDKYKDDMVKEINPYYYYRFLIDIRNKLNQSLKAIASKYYQNMSISTQTPDVMEKAEDIVQNLSEVITSSQVISYLSNITQLTQLEIESILFDMENNTDIHELLKSIVAKLLVDYDSIDRIRDMDPFTLLKRINKKDDYISLTDDILKSLNVDNITQSHRDLILMLCILLILWKR